MRQDIFHTVAQKQRAKIIYTNNLRGFCPGKRLWSQWGWHARTGACQGEYTASGTAQQPLSHSIQTHPSKKCHPLWSLQHNPNPLPFDHYSSNTQQSHTSQYRTSFSHSLSILLSLWLSACPLVRRNQPVSPLWADMAASPLLRRPVEATKHAI